MESRRQLSSLLGVGSHGAKSRRLNWLPVDLTIWFPVDLANLVLSHLGWSTSPALPPDCLISDHFWLLPWGPKTSISEHLGAIAAT